MKAGPIVLAITFAVILVLPDTYGAPSCADSKSDVVLSEQVEKESSKSSDTSAQEQKVDKETQSKCSNGLASGSKSSSESRDLKHSEEEQSRSATERKTATGTERVEESLKKKKVVTVSEKKNVLVYYMVSYKKLPAKGKDECEKAYYTRIFPKEDNLHVFYRKIFKAYEGEAPAAYINRIEFIMGHVYPDLDCRLDVKWLEQFDHYYTLKYSRKLNEPDNQYYHRILEKEEGETCEHYQKRMECLVAALDEEDFSHISFDYSNLSYNIGVRKTPAKSYSSPSSSGQKIGEEVTSSKKSTENAESLDESESSVEQKSQKGSSSQHQKNLKKKKVSVEKEEQTKSATYRMAYSKLPERKPGVDLSSYYKSFFGSCGSSLSEQAARDLYLRVLMQYKGESCKDYVKRIDYICDNVYPHLDIKTNQGYTNLLEHYYRVKYEKLKDETEEKWYDRVLCKVKGETPEHYKSRVSCLQSCLKEINWSRITIDPNSSTGYSLVSSLGKVGQVTKKSCGNERIEKKVVKEQKQVHKKSLEERKEVQKVFLKEQKNAQENLLKKQKKAQEKALKAKKKAQEKALQEQKKALKEQKKAQKKALKEQKNAQKKALKEQKKVLKERRKALKKQKKAQEKALEEQKKIQEAEESGEEETFIGKAEEKVSGFFKGLWNAGASVVKKIKSEESKEGSSEESKEESSEESKEESSEECSGAKKVEASSASGVFSKKSSSSSKQSAAKSKHSSSESYHSHSASDCAQGASYVKAEKSSQSSKSKAASASSSAEEVKVDSASGQFSQKSSSSSSQSASSSSQSYSASTVSKNTQKSIKKELTVEEIKKTYAKTEKEDTASYFKRITSKSSSSSSTEEYIKTLTIVRKCYPDLDLWYDRKYIDLVKDFYSAVYAKKSEETQETYFKRIMTKESYESDEQCIKRAVVLHDMYPNLALWYDEKYYSFTKKFYQYYYKKSTTEDETTYFKRICAKSLSESSTEYVKRISLLKNTFNNLSLWYDTKYINIVKDFYTAEYTKKTTETEEHYYKRIITKESYESDEQFINRAVVLHSLYPTLSVWSDKKYYESLTKKFYQTVYKKSQSEDDTTYFKRICTKSSKESTMEYINRIKLVKKTFRGLSLWSDIKYVNLVKDYYCAVYAKHTAETEEHYFQRIVKKESDESDEELVQKAVVLHELFPRLSLWTDEKYYESFTKKFYQTVYKKSESEDKETYFKRICTKSSKESTTEYVKRVSLLKKTLSKLELWSDSKYFDLVKNYYAAAYTKQPTETEEHYYQRIVRKEAYESVQQWIQRSVVLHSLYPSLSVWSDKNYYESFTKKVYQSIYKKSKSEDESTYFKRICTRSSKESSTEYVNRIKLLKKTFRNLSLWSSTKYIDLVKDYYTAAYAKKSSETKEQYFQRIVTKKSYESEEQLFHRAVVLHQLYPTLSLWSDEKFYESFTKKLYQSIFKKSATEDESTYFKRICTKTSSESSTEYIKRVSLLKKTFSSLSLWYDTKYINLVKDYYTSVYTKETSETEEQYYQRIVKKESYESDEQWIKRAILVHNLYPDLSLWYNTNYYESFTKKVYTSIYKKSTTEDETTYFKRICTKSSSESEEAYVSRMSLIEKTYSSLSLWSSVKYSSIVKQYYSLKYAKKSSETEEAYFSRLVAKESCDTSDDIYIKRLNLVHELTASSALWYEEKYYEKYTKAFYQSYYKKSTTEDETTYFKRICKKSSSESEEAYVSRMSLIEKTHSYLSLWSSAEHSSIIKQYYSLKYAKKSSETQEAYFSRLVAKESCDTSDNIYFKRLDLVHKVTPSCPLWYEEKYYNYIKAFYQSYYKKTEKETCDGWLTNAIKQLPEESEEISLKRIALIKKASLDCECWTSEWLSKVEATNAFSAEYISKIKSACFASYYESSSSSSSTSSASSSSSSSEEVVLVSRD